MPATATLRGRGSEPLDPRQNPNRGAPGPRNQDGPDPGATDGLTGVGSREHPRSDSRFPIPDSRTHPLEPDGGKAPLLTADEEIALARRIKAGDRAALAELVAANLGLCHRPCVRFRGASDLSHDDLMQEASIGLMRAAESFDPDLHKSRFASYAYPWIKGALASAVGRTGHVVRTPAHLRSLRRRLAALVAAEPDADDARICHILGTTPERLAAARRPHLARIVPGTDRRGDARPFDPADPSPGADAPEAIDPRWIVSAALNALSPIEALVIRRLHGLTYGGNAARPAAPLTIARAYKIPLARVRKAEASAMAKLRDHMVRLGA